MKKPEYHELVNALVGMACQYLEDNIDGNLSDNFVSAGEETIDILENLGLVKDNKIIPEAFDYNFLKDKYSINTKKG